MKKIGKFVLIGLLLFLFAGYTVSASGGYQTYTYSYEGKELLSPDAYRYTDSISGVDLGVGRLSDPGDIFSDSSGNVYIADTQNNRIICLDSDYRLQRIIDKFTNPTTNEQDSFNLPGGIYVTDEGSLYVADTNNGRVIEFKASTGEAIRVLERPQSHLLDGYAYTPDALVVDDAGRIYVVSTSVNVGVVELEADGSFSGFLGAKRVQLNMAELFWRMFMTKEQKAATVKMVPSSYNNIAIDDIGFLYTTTNSYEDWEIQSYVYNRMKDDTYAPVRRLNSTGIDVLKRNGFHPPVGDVNFEIGHTIYNGASEIVDVALNKDGAYTLLDQKRGKLFTYDDNGNLLYAFGGMGVQNGLVGKAEAIAYKGRDLLLLDSQNGVIIVYTPTEYGDLFYEALTLTSERKYDESALKWQEILKYNSNNEMAYAAMGQNYLLNQDYKSAMECFKAVRDVSNYSEAFAELRNDVIRKIAIPLVLVVAALVVLFFKLSAKAKVINQEGQSAAVKKTIGRQLIYAWHIIFHPFDGFYDMKHENRGSVKSATIILVFTTLAFSVKQLMNGFIFTGDASKEATLLGSVITILLPFILWCAANWCLTTLLNGEGKFRDIYMAACYSLVPIALSCIPIAILSNVLTLEESGILSLVWGAVLGWSALLFILGCMTIHNYTFGKNLLMVILTIIGMAVILFLALLFVNVLQKMISFVVNIYNEVTFRL